jgi:hypothetical protein
VVQSHTGRRSKLAAGFAYNEILEGSLFCIERCITCDPF